MSAANWWSIRLMSSSHWRLPRCLEQLGGRFGVAPGRGTEAPLLLPPVLAPEQPRSLSQCLEPLLARAAATAKLQAGPASPGSVPAVPVPAATVGKFWPTCWKTLFASDPGGDLGLWIALS